MKLKAHHVGAGEGPPINRRKRGRTYSQEPKTKISHSYPQIMPVNRITTIRIPWNCVCKWDVDFTNGGWWLKFYNMGCPAKREGAHG